MVASIPLLEFYKIMTKWLIEFVKKFFLLQTMRKWSLCDFEVFC